MEAFYASANHLSGTIQPLSGLANLFVYRIEGNQLSGDMVAVPESNSLLPGFSSLCPNHLSPASDVDWDTATGATPWHEDCEPLPDLIFSDGFGDL